MTKKQRILLGITSILPLSTILFWQLITYSIYYHIIPGATGSIDEFATGSVDDFISVFFMLWLIFLLCFIQFILTTLFLLVVYIIHIVKHKTGKERIAWVAIVTLINILAFPVYWWLYIKSEPSPQKQLQLPI